MEQEVGACKSILNEKFFKCSEAQRLASEDVENLQNGRRKVKLEAKDDARRVQLNAWHSLSLRHGKPSLWLYNTAHSSPCVG